MIGIIRKGMAAVLLALLAAAAPPAPAAVHDPALQLAERYARALGPRLDDRERATLQAIRGHLQVARSRPDEVRKRVHVLVNQLTIELATLPSPGGILAASAELVRFDPENARATQLFGAVLHALSCLDDAATVLEVTAQQQSDSWLILTNLANVHLDLGNDARAKALLDQALKLDPDNRSIWKALAVYWFRKPDMAKFQDALRRSSTFAGFVKRKEQDASDEVDRHEVKTGDGVDVAAAKLGQLKDSVPLTMADVIEQEFPREARAIRERYGRLLEPSRVRLPLFPQVKTNTNQDYAESFPIIQGWIEAFGERYRRFQERERLGLKGGESEAQIEALAQQYGQGQVQQAFQNAQDAMKFIDGLEGMSASDKAAARSALGQVQGAAAQQGVTLSPSPLDGETPPGWDSGSRLARTNYRNYTVITRSYEQTLRLAFAEYKAKEQDNLRVYLKKIREENDNHDRIQEDLDRRHDDRAHDDADPAIDMPCFKERLRHRKKKNEIGDTYYKLWINLYVPLYTQRLKPMLEDYWGVAGLYIRNMTDPQVMQREYLRVKDHVLLQAVYLAGAAGIGGAFEYFGPTRDDEEALQRVLEAAHVEADLRRPKVLKDYQPGREKDWVDWIGDNLVFEVAGELLSLKITARSIEFEAWFMAPGAGVKVDFVDSTVETYISISKKVDFGITIANVKLGKVEGKVEVAKRTAKWDLAKGEYSETTDLSAKGEAKAAFGTEKLGLQATSEFEVDAELNCKIGAKAGAYAKVGGIDYSLTKTGETAGKFWP